MRKLPELIKYNVDYKMIYVLQYGINFDSDVKENEAKEKMQKLFKPDTTFEARVKNIDFIIKVI